MFSEAPHLDAETWLRQVFQSKAAAQGGVVRRQLRDIEPLVDWSRFEHELSRRGFRAVRNAGQIVIFCNGEPVHVIR